MLRKKELGSSTSVIYSDSLTNSKKNVEPNYVLSLLKNSSSKNSEEEKIVLTQKSPLRSKVSDYFDLDTASSSTESIKYSNESCTIADLLSGEGEWASMPHSIMQIPNQRIKYTPVTALNAICLYDSDELGRFRKEGKGVLLFTSAD